MAAKRKITFKKKVAEVEKPSEIEETPVSFVDENEISDDEIPSGTVFQEEEEIFVRKQPKNKVIGSIGDTVVAKPKGRIRFEAEVAPVPLFKLPADIRQYLINNGLSSNVWKKDKEWLEKHNVDMEMVERLKEFLSGNN